MLWCEFYLKHIQYQLINLNFCREPCVGENNGVREYDDCEVQLGEGGGTIGWCHTHTSCASLMKMNKKLEICSFIFFCTFAGKAESHCFWFSFFLSKEPTDCVKKAVSVNEGKDMGRIISKNNFNEKMSKKN